MKPFLLRASLLAGFALVATASAQTTTYSLFSDSDAPQVAIDGDTSPVEVGVRFYATESGTINAIRFYRGTQGNGTFRVRLWDAAGNVLGEGNVYEGLTNPVPGWQSIPLQTPVRIEAGETYVASYYNSGGGYSVTEFYFTGNGVDTGVLVAPADGQLPDGGPTSVYRYGVSGGFPTDTYAGTNYWVDVVFAPERPEYDAFTSDTQPIQVGTKFIPTRAGTVSAIRFYRGNAGSGYFFVQLYRGNGTLVGEGFIQGTLAGPFPGWKEIALNTPVNVQPGETYVASYYQVQGQYAFTGNYYTTERTIGYLTYPVAAGVYLYGFGGGFPNQSYQNSRYWVEPVYTPAP